MYPYRLSTRIIDRLHRLYPFTYSNLSNTDFTVQLHPTRPDSNPPGFFYFLVGLKDVHPDDHLRFTMEFPDLRAYFPTPTHTGA